MTFQRRKILTKRKTRTSLQGENRRLAIKMYGEGLGLGMTIQEIADMINDQLGLDCEKTTYYRAYFYDPRPWEEDEVVEEDAIENLERFSESKSEDDFLENVLDKKLEILASKEVSILEERKKLIRERAIVEERVKDYVDKSAVSDAIHRIYSEKVKPLFSVKSFVSSSSGVIPMYGFGDIHWGYTINDGKLVYNTGVAAGRLDAMFDYISKDIIENGYKEIYIADLADDIEGAALRTSQLLRIVESMTEQAKGYSDYLVKKIRNFAEKHKNIKITFIHIEEDNHSQLRLHNTNRDELPENLQLLITNHIRVYIEASHSFGHLTNLEYISASEVVLEFNRINMVVAHGHQYSKSDDILEKASKRHEIKAHVFLAGHWHQYSHKNRDVHRGVQESLIFLPAIVGDTDYSDRLFLSSRPGFSKIMIYDDEGYVTSRQILFSEKGE